MRSSPEPGLLFHLLMQDVLVLAAAGGVLPRDPAHWGCYQQSRRRSPEVAAGRRRRQGLMQRTQVRACAPVHRFRPRAGRPSGVIGLQLLGNIDIILLLVVVRSE